MPEILKQNQAASHKKAVVFCADRNVVRFAQFIANQIMLAEPGRDYDICITTFDGTMVELDKIDPEIRICQVDDAPFSALKTSNRVTSTAFILLALPEIFAKDYDQIVYLDTDVFLKSGKISELFAAAVPGFAISGVLDITQWAGTPDAARTDYWQALGINGLKYLNTGVLVLDVPRCIKENFYKGSLQAAITVEGLKKAKPQIRFLHDQTAINMHLAGEWAPISLRWNWQTLRETSRLNKYFNPNILHFIAHTKPWVAKPVAYNKAFLPEYTRFFKDVLGEDLKAKIRQDHKNVAGLTWLQKIKSEITPQKLSARINMINPLYYTGLRGLIPTYVHYKNIKRIEKAIALGHPVWPREKMIAASK